MRSITLRYGLRMTAALLALFSLAHLTGAIHHPALRLLNGFVHVGFIYLAIRKYRIEYPREWNYASGVAHYLNPVTAAAVITSASYFSMRVVDGDREVRTLAEQRVPVR